MKKNIILIVVVVTVALIGVVWTFVIPSGSEGSPYDEEILPPSGRQDDNDFDQNDIDSGRDDTGLTQATCSSAGGTWNPCGSACRTDPEAICIELCVEYCECKSDLECPSGYTCGDVVEGVGVCL